MGDLEMIALVDNKLTAFESGTFNGQIFDANGIPDDLFKDLVSLEYLSTFINNVGVLKNVWFGAWSAKLESIAIFLYQTAPKPPLVIEDGVFDKLPSLIDISTYTSGNVISPTDVVSNKDIMTVLYGSQFDINIPLPEPALYKEDLI